MTVLITGGAGYIGSHMVLELVDAGERVVVLDNLSSGHRDAVPDGVPLARRRYRRPDTRDAAHTRQYEIETIIHFFAASVVVSDSMRDPLSYYHNNTANSRVLIECAAKGGVQHFYLLVDRPRSTVTRRSYL